MALMYENCKILGPYDHSDGTGRQIVLIYFPDGSRETTTYARYLVECEIDRKLTWYEDVDHIDDDCTNDSLDNLQILTKLENLMKSQRSIELLEVECANCGVPFDIEARRYRHNQLKQGKAGPYCSRSCAGKVHH